MMEPEEFASHAADAMEAVYRFVVSLIGEQHAGRFLQDLYADLRQEQPPGSTPEVEVRHWLFARVYQRFMSQLSDAQRSSLFFPQTESATPEATATPTSFDDRLRAALEHLPPGARAIFLLSAVEAFRYSDIATITKLDVSMVMNQLAQARSQLARALRSS